MSDLRRVIDMYLNVEDSDRVELKGTAFVKAAPQTLYRGTQILFRVHLMMSDATTYYNPPSSATWLFGIDNTYTRDSADLVVSQDASFIASDWSSSDFTGGKICWRADLSTAELKSGLADVTFAEMYCALWMYPQAGADPTLMAHWDILMHNVAVDPTSATPVDSITYVTATNLANIIEQYTRGNGVKAVRIYDADGGILLDIP